MEELRLSFPVKIHFVNQLFGVNGDFYRKNGINIKGHNGLDIRAYHGQPIYAAHEGIAYYQVDENQGEGVVIRTIQPFNYKGKPTYFKSIYWHMVDTLVEPKFKQIVPRDGRPFPVKRGDLIGYADNTGFTTGDHLHFGLKPIMPGQAPTDGDAPDIGIGNWVNVDGSNGYLGAIDPTPYWNNYYAQDTGTVISIIQKLLAALRESLLLVKK